MTTLKRTVADGLSKTILHSTCLMFCPPIVDQEPLNGQAIRLLFFGQAND